jgi:hypothetical protein
MKWEILGAAIVSTDGPYKYLISEQTYGELKPTRWQAWRLQKPSSVDVGTYRTVPLAQAGCDDDCRRQAGLYPYMTAAGAPADLGPAAGGNP